MTIREFDVNGVREGERGRGDKSEEEVKTWLTRRGRQDEERHQVLEEKSDSRARKTR